MNKTNRFFNKKKKSVFFNKFFTKRNLIVSSIFIVFLFLRLFTDSSSVLLSADNLKYMEAAKRFPGHILYNDQLYLLHPPFYPYVISLFSLIFREHYISALVISLLSSIISFFIIYKLFMLLTGNFTTTFFVLSFYSLSSSFIFSAKAALKESFVIMLILLSLYYYLRGIKFSEKSSLIKSTIFGGILALSSDHVIFLFPVVILSYLFFNNKEISLKSLKFPNLKYLIIPIAIIFVSYASWNAVKFYQYYNNEYYPNGVEGTPINTDYLSPLTLISPTYFNDWTYAKTPSGLISTAKKFAFQLGYMFNMEPFSIPGGLNLSTMKFLLLPKHILYIFVIYIPLAIMAFLGFFSIIRDFFRARKIYNNANLYLIGLFLVFLTPLIQRIVSPRYIYTSYIFLFYFISYGIFLIFLRKRDQKIHFKVLSFAIIILLLIVPFWYYTNSNFILSAKKIVGAQNTANFINLNLNKEDAIMAQPGYAVKLIYLTGHRTVGLYPKPENLLDLIDYYNVKYLVFGRFYTYDQYHYALDSVEYIKNSPDKFELIATIKEDYSDFYVKDDPARTDEVYIYKIKN